VVRSTRRSFFEWINVLNVIPDNDVIMHCRKDGFLYLLFIQYLYKYFFIITVLNCAVLLPIFLINTKIDTQLLAAYTIKSIIGQNWKLWVVLAFTIIYTIMAFIMLYLFRQRLRTISETENKGMIDSLCMKRALQITGLPPEMLGKAHEARIMEFFEEIIGENEVISVKLVPDYKEMYSLILEKNKILEKLERTKKANMRIHIREKIRKGVLCCKQYVDAESEYTNMLENIQKEEEKNKNVIIQGTGTAFVIFRSPENAYNARRIVRRKFHLGPRYSDLHLENWYIKKAPPPSDIIWENMGISKMYRILLLLMSNVPLIIISVLMVVPMVILDGFKNIVDIINNEMRQKGLQSSFSQVFIDNYLPPLLLYLNSSLIVPFLIYFVATYERRERLSHLEKSVLAKNIAFMLFDIIVLPAFGLSTIYSLLEQEDWYFY